MFDFVQREQPDILCLQEVKAFQGQTLEILRPPFFATEVWHSAEKPGYSGVANLSRSHFPTALGMGEPMIDREGRVLKSDLGGAALLNMYFPNGAMNEERHLFKMRFLEKILTLFQQLDREQPLILTGDFNIAHREIDIHDPVRLDGESGFKPEEREWMDQLVAAGFTDVFRELNPDVRDAYTWWSYRQMSRKRNKGWRIDYFFVSKRLLPKVKRITLHPEILGSDHCPLALEILI